MTVKQIFALGVKLGIESDPRGKKGVERYLSRIKREYGEMKPEDQKYFDHERLSNPYPDSAVHVDDGGTEVKRVLAGIDIGPGEILLASQLNERGKHIDLVIAHHPAGKALARLHEVMDMAVDFFVSLGLPVHIAEKIMEDRVREVGRGVHMINHYQTVNIAAALGINFMNTHTITDNLVHRFIVEHVTERQPETLGDLMSFLLEIPEYQEAKHQQAGPKIYSGSPHHRVGKILVEMTGGTEPSNKMYEYFSRSGISTIVGMHMREQSHEKSAEHQLNTVMAGHISSDSIGMNLFLDELEKRGIEIVPCGGLIRVSRNKKKKRVIGNEQ